jgi:hypothetical protein
MAITARPLFDETGELGHDHRLHHTRINLPAPIFWQLQVKDQRHSRTLQQGPCSAQSVSCRQIPKGYWATARTTKWTDFAASARAVEQIEPRKNRFESKGRSVNVTAKADLQGLT